MSMISSQVGELRFMAHMLDTDGHPSFACEVRRAADTILELRNKLACVIDQSEEIERLKEQVCWLKKGDVLHVLTDQELADRQKHEREMRASIDALEDENARLRSCLSDDAENARQIMAENAKLREYAELYAKAVEGEGCGWCLYDTCAMCDVETIPMRDGCKLYDELRELGIEVE